MEQNEREKMIDALLESKAKVQQLEEIIKLVADMRNAQKEYFKTRDKGVLAKSKRLESWVDNLLAKVQGTMPSLF